MILWLGLGLLLAGCTSVFVDCQKMTVQCVDCNIQEAERAAALLEKCWPPGGKK